MKSEEKWEYYCKIIKDAENDLITEEEMNLKLLEFKKNMVDKDYAKWMLENRYPEENSKMNKYYKKILEEL